MSTTAQSDLYDTITPASVAAEVVKINRRLAALEQSVRDVHDIRLMVAEQLDALAEDIGYPINDIAKTRKHLRDLAAKLRAEASGVRHG